MSGLDWDCGWLGKGARARGPFRCLQRSGAVMCYAMLCYAQSAVCSVQASARTGDQLDVCGSGAFFSSKLARPDRCLEAGLAGSRQV